jgi:poly-beta-1,6-N-acetyl-D-glucosamine synthase
MTSLHIAASEKGQQPAAVAGGELSAGPVDEWVDEQAIGCSVGIMAYNEEANIANAIDAIVNRQLKFGTITDLTVVASGCTDRTPEIVAEIGREDPRVRLIVQDRRLGKASAINLFVGAAQSPVLLMVSADVLVTDDTIDAMLRHFQDPTVGMVGGHPIPVNNESTFLGYAVHLLWRLHDRLAREAPKLGEIVAFRNVVPSIPVDTAVDEISIQALVTQLGYRLVYEPGAVVYNHGPATVADFLRQRRRIHAGHLHVRRQQGYVASTMSLRRIAHAMKGSGSFATPRRGWLTVGTIGLEAAARALGRYDALRHRPHTVWQTVSTTKRHIAGDRDSYIHQSVLVFNIVNFHRLRLELGQYSSHQLTRKLAQRIQHSLETTAAVTPQKNGTIVATVSVDRDEAERIARDVMHGLEGHPLRLSGHGDSVSMKLACGIIAFSQSGQAHVGSIQLSGPAAQ